MIKYVVPKLVYLLLISQRFLANNSENYMDTFQIRYFLLQSIDRLS